MYRRVKIKKLPQARTGYQVQGSLANDVPAFGGADYNAYIGKPNLKQSRYIKAVPREEANLEAEGGETVFGDINGDGIPEHKIIKGPRHHSGGVPLNLPEDTFIFSDTKSMKISDPNILKTFGKSPKKGKGQKGFTPAELAKQYDIDKYRKILQDPDSDAIAVKTAELMIRNFNIKLGALALAQESKKGFPQGIPMVAEPYMEANKISPEEILPPELPEQSPPEDLQQQQQQMPQQGMMQEQSELPEQEMAEGNDMAMAEMQGMMPPDMGYSPNPEEMPMGMYGMQMGGYDFPFAQYGISLGGGNSNNFKGRRYRVPGSMRLMQNGGFTPNWNIIDPNNVIPKIDPKTNWVNPPSFNNESEDTGPGAVLRRMYENPEEYYPEQELSPEMIQMLNEQAPAEPLEIPQQQYGGYMDLGGYDMPFYPTSDMSYMTGDEDYMDMPMYPGGGSTPPANAEIVKRSDYATDEDYQFALRKAYNRTKSSGKKIYVEKDGKYNEIKAEYKDVAAHQGALDAGWGTDDNAALRAGQYDAIEKALSDPQAAKIFADYTRKALQDKESYKGKNQTYGATYQSRGFGDPSQLTDEEIVNSFKEHQKRNLMLASSGYESYLFKDANGKLRDYDSSGTSGDKLGFKDVIMKTQNPKTGKPYTEAEAKAQFDKFTKDGVKSLDDAFTKLGLPLPAVAKGSTSEKKALLQQGTFQGYDRMIKDLNSGNIKNEDDAARILNFVGNVQRGYQDEFGQSVTDISPIDAYYTNTTAGQISAIKDLAFSEIPEPCPCNDESGNIAQRDENGNCPCDTPKDCPCGKDESTGECKPCDDSIPPPPPPAQWWLQDTIKTAGAFGDMMGIKKYMPWSPRVDLEEPRPTFLDPTRELAQQSEQANLAIMNLAAFAGPQALSSRASSIQGTGAKSAADTLSRINNANVGIADNFEMKQVDIRNQEALANQAGQQKLYDANTIANQQFDNSRMALRNQMRNHYTNAITNKAKTAALNELYPQYAVLPETGGMPGFKGGKKNKAEVTKTAQEYFDEIKLQYPDMDDKTAYQMAKDRAGTQTSNDNAMDVINAQYNIPSGTQMRYGGFANGGFVYGDSIYPFFFT